MSVQTAIKNILTINGGSSSIKFSIYSNEKIPQSILSGKIERIGLKDPALSFTDPVIKEKKTIPVNAASVKEAVGSLLSWLEKRTAFDNLFAIGQRIVHGMQITDPQLITDSLLINLQNISSYDPDHLPGEIELIKTFQKKLPHIPQVACFDTAFHSTIPRLASLLPLPRKFDEQGIRKYGFHGLSYSYLMEQLIQLQVPAATKGKVILAHLGSGASIAAVLDGKSVDTSMGFTPAAGFLMGTRAGDLDPGLTALIMNKESMSADQFNQFVNQQCGLLGVSETSSDMQDLLKKEDSDHRASEAVNLFCYQVKKWIGAFTTVLKGLDVLVFTGGIGENAAAVRFRICEGLKFMGIEINENENAKNARIISSKNSRVVVHVIPTNEELMIAKLVHTVLSN